MRKRVARLEQGSIAFGVPYACCCTWLLLVLVAAAPPAVLPAPARVARRVQDQPASHAVRTISSATAATAFSCARKPLANLPFLSQFRHSPFLKQSVFVCLRCVGGSCACDRASVLSFLIRATLECTCSRLLLVTCTRMHAHGFAQKNG